MGSTSDGSSPGRGKIRLRLGLEDDSEGVILNLRNVYYLPSSPCNLVSLGLLNDSGIFHDNRNETRGSCSVGLALLESSSSSSSQLVRKAETWSCSQFFSSSEVSSVISSLALSASSCLFGVGLSVLPARFLVSFSVVLGSFSSSEALVDTFLPARVFLGFWRGFGLAFSSSEALLSSDGPCSSGICVASNVGFPSKSGRVEKALVEVSSKIRRSLTLITLF